MWYPHYRKHNATDRGYKVYGGCVVKSKHSACLYTGLAHYLFNITSCLTSFLATHPGDPGNGHSFLLVPWYTYNLHTSLMGTRKP